MQNSTNGSAALQHIHIYNMPPTARQLLCDHLDELNAWPELAKFMKLKPADVMSIRRQQMQGSSPTEALLKIWGGQYNHTVTELFMVFEKKKLFQAMRLIKNLVAREYHLLIPNSQPIISELLARSQQTNEQHAAKTEKLLNRHVGAGNDSNSNNLYSRDDNFSTSLYSDSSSNNSSSNSAQHTSQQNSNYLSESNVKAYASCLLEINYFELSEATNNWSEKNILGKGGFGTVYWGYWKHTDVAIKQIHYRGVDGRESIKVQLQQSLNELKYLNSCRHDNVLPLYGYSIKGEKPCLVYQLMKGGSLEERLYSKKMAPLTWQQRMTICLGTARGINYLHTFRDKPLIHGDIKPANVLLDQCLWPKIGDFGLAREGPNAINSAIQVTQVFGTKPYLPPEFLNSKKLSTQVDTYSFGVVLLEIFTGLRAYDKNRSDLLLTKFIMKLCASTNVQLEQLIDKKVPLLQNETEMCKRSIQLGLECIADNPQHRPEMVQVLKAINCYFNTSNGNQ